MNTPDFTAVKRFTKVAVLAVAFLQVGTASADWSVDFSRRAKAVRDSDLLDGRSDRRWDDTSAASRYPEREPASVAAPQVNETSPDKVDSKGLFDTLFDAGEPVQDIVIMQTEKGFVPSSVRVRKNGRYKIHVVNVNEKEKNVSFILDGFSEHHATYFGKIKSFLLEPKKEGAYSFQSPETSAEGKLIVYSLTTGPQVALRATASEGSAK